MAMTVEQKQIEEMAIIIAKQNCKPCGCENCDFAYEYGTKEESCEDFVSYRKIAEAFYNTGCRKPTVLTIDQLKALPLREWVWIEILIPFECEDKASAYYRKQADYTHEKAFCCGYPGLSFSFYYEEYGKTWVTYTHQPKECEI